MFGLIVGLNRWNQRVVAHAALTTDRDGRAKRVQEIIAARDACDQRADAPDPAADQRDGVIDRAAFLSTEDDVRAARQSRRPAAGDRIDAENDRSSSAHGRSDLADEIDGVHENT